MKTRIFSKICGLILFMPLLAFSQNTINGIVKGNDGTLLPDVKVEIQENFFRKMLKQGGTFKVAGIKYKVELIERSDLDSNGNKPVTVPPLPGERTF